MEETLLLDHIIKNWTELNLNRSTTAEKRKQEKVFSIHSIVTNLAAKAGLDQEYLEEAIKHHEKYTDPAPLLDSYRVYFPEFEPFLQALRTSEQIDSRLRFPN